MSGSQRKKMDCVLIAGFSSHVSIARRWVQIDASRARLVCPMLSRSKAQISNTWARGLDGVRAASRVVETVNLSIVAEAATLFYPAETIASCSAHWSRISKSFHPQSL